MPALPERFVVDAGLDVVQVTGDDRLAFLDDVLSQRLRGAQPGEVLGALELEQHGSALLVADVVVLEDRVLLLVPAAPPREDTPPPLTPPGRTPPPMPDLAAAAIARLGARTFLLDARFARRDDLGVLLHVDPALTTSGRQPGGPRGVAVVQGSDHDADVVVHRDGHRLVITADPAARRATIAADGAVVADPATRAAWGVATGQPAWGREVVAPHLPEELGLLPTHVHLAKGCYPGQEAVARMWLLGRPRRRLARVTVTGAVTDLPIELGAGRRRVTVTAVLDDGTGLAFVPGDAAVGDVVAAPSDEEPGDAGEGVTVTVLDVLGADDHPPGHDPRQVRRRDRRAAAAG